MVLDPNLRSRDLMLPSRPSPAKAYFSLLEKNSEGNQSLQNDKSTCIRNFAWSLDYATAVAVGTIRSSAKEIRTALRNVVDVAIPRVAPERGIFTAFSELDTKIFGGRMKEAVYLKWSNLGDRRPGKTSTPGTVNPRITIELDQRLIYGTKSQLILVLLHQMVHAYFLVCCAQSNAPSSRDLRLGHGRHFSAIIYAILGLYSDRYRQGARHRSLRPESLGRRSSKWRWESAGINEGWQMGQRIRLGSTRPEESCKASSTCLEALNCDISFDRALQWYEDECAHIDVSCAGSIYVLTEGGMEQIPRTKAGLGSDYVELVWDGKAFKMPISRVDANPSLKFRLARQKNGRELQVPPVSEDSFRILYNFVKLGGYGPELMKVQNNLGNEPGFASSSGPPEIRETRKEWPEFLATDIKAVKLAADLGLFEMESHGLRRLFAQHFTHNDPITALEALYEDDWIPEKLRDWAVAFMAKPLSFRRAGQTEGFNLHLLQRSLSFSSGMTRLMARSVALREDVDRAVARISHHAHEQVNPMTIMQPVAVPMLQQASYPMALENTLAGSNSISLPPHWWNETNVGGVTYADATDRRGALSVPPNTTRLPGHVYPQAYGPSDRLWNKHGEFLEARY